MKSLWLPLPIALSLITPAQSVERIVLAEMFTNNS